MKGIDGSQESCIGFCTYSKITTLSLEMEYSTPVETPLVQRCTQRLFICL